MENNGIRKLFTIWYKGFLVIFILLFISVSAVIPVDAIAQALNSTNHALNTFTIAGAIIIFIILGVFIGTSRIIVQRSCIQYIPKCYIPITLEDISHRPTWQEISKYAYKTHYLSIVFREPSDRVINDGIEPPREQLNEKDESCYNLPDYLDYKLCVKSISDRLKFRGIFMNNMARNPQASATFSQLIQSHFIQQNEQYKKEAYEYIDLYERIRYSNKEVKRNDFIRFMDLSIFFGDCLMGKKQECNQSPPYFDSASPFLNIPFTNYNNHDVSCSDEESNSSKQYQDPLPGDFSSLRRMNTNNTVVRRFSSSHLDVFNLKTNKVVDSI